MWRLKGSINQQQIHSTHRIKRQLSGVTCRQISSVEFSGVNKGCVSAHRRPTYIYILHQTFDDVHIVSKVKDFIFSHYGWSVCSGLSFSTYPNSTCTMCVLQTIQIHVCACSIDQSESLVIVHLNPDGWAPNWSGAVVSIHSQLVCC